jgi:hypothetical protein
MRGTIYGHESGMRNRETDAPLQRSRKKGKSCAMRKIMCLIIVGLVLGAGIQIAAGSSKEEAAVSAAQKWLSMVDEGKYAESWKEAAEYFRSAVKQSQWEQSLQAVRKPLGKLVTRTVKSRSYMTSLPGAPDGEYVVIQFETSFENKKSAVETVTPMLDKEGNWRVSGYFIK